MNTYLSDENIATLRTLIGQTIKSITADNWKPHGFGVGNVLIETEDNLYSIVNDFEILPFEEYEEEISAFSFVQLDSKDDYFMSAPPEEMLTEIIDKKVERITIIRDRLTMTYDNHEDTHIIDTAIVIGFHDFQWLISEESIFSPLTYMYFDVDVTPYFPSADSLAEVFDYEPTSGFKPYTTSVTRELIHLKE